MASQIRLWPLLIADDPPNKVIPSGAKVFFRWSNNQTKVPNNFNDASLFVETQAVTRGRIELEMAKMPSSMITDREVNSLVHRFFRPPSSPSSFPNGLLSVGIILIVLIGLLFSYFIVRFVIREPKGDRQGRRQLQVMLVSKRKESTERQKVIEAAFAGENGTSMPNQQGRPFPRRVYELQAEDGYFSSAPSMHNSFETDQN